MLTETGAFPEGFVLLDPLRSPHQSWLALLFSHLCWVGQNSSLSQSSSALCLYTTSHLLPVWDFALSPFLTPKGDSRSVTQPLPALPSDRPYAQPALPFRQEGWAFETGQFQSGSHRIVEGLWGLIFSPVGVCVTPPLTDRATLKVRSGFSGSCPVKHSKSPGWRFLATASPEPCSSTLKK